MLCVYKSVNFNLLCAQKLLERKDSGVPDEEPPKRPANPFLMAGGGGGMSFLDQIKAKRKTEE